MDFFDGEEVMETLILVFDAPAPDPDSFADVLRVVATVQADDQQIVVAKDDARAYLRVLNDSEDEVFSDWPPDAMIPKEPRILALDYRSDTLAKMIVCVLAAEHQFLIDTNYGTVLRSDEFCRKAAEDSWTWERY